MGDSTPTAGVSGAADKRPIGSLIPKEAAIHVSIELTALARTGHRGRSLDYPVRPLQQRRRDSQTERLGGLDVDDQLEFG